MNQDFTELFPNFSLILLLNLRGLIHNSVWINETFQTGFFLTFYFRFTGFTGVTERVPVTLLFIMDLRFLVYVVVIIDGSPIGIGKSIYFK